MSDILITVSDQSMIFTSKPVIASNGINEDYCEFTFDATWSGYAKTATFNKASEPDNVYLSVLVGNRALIPHEVLDAPGIIFIGVRGTYNDVTLTAEKLPYPIVPGADANGQNTQPPSPGIYDQILQMVLSMVGSPLVANTAADMTDEGRIYVYTGSEAGYVTGDWYYYDGATWVSGGVYNSQGIGASYLELVADYVKQSAVATFTDNTPYLYRPTPNPSAILADEKIIGGTVAWNQLVKNGNFADGTDEWGVNSASGFSVTSGVASFTATANGGRLQSASNSSIPILNGHKFISLMTVNIANNANFRIYGVAGKSRDVVGTGAFAEYSIAEAATADGTKGYFPRVTDTRSSGWTEIKVQNVFSIDLTAMFGSTIADYLYTLESGTAGAGVAKLREWGFLSKAYFPYNAGELMSVKTSGKRVTGSNIFGGNLLRDGVLAGVSGASDVSTSRYVSFSSGATNLKAITDGVPFKPNTQYTFIMTLAKSSGTGSNLQILYDDGTTASFPNLSDATKTERLSFTTTAGKTVSGLYKRSSSGTTYLYYDESGIFEGANHQFAPFKYTTYPTTDTDLNGIYKLDANNNLYADGDVYAADGTVTRKYAAIDMGDLPWGYNSNGYLYAWITGKAPGNFNLLCARYITTTATATGDMLDKEIKGNAGSTAIYVKDSAYTDGATFATAMSGVYIVYELATPTTETATPYTACQIVGKGGTEEWIDSRSVPVPVGHETVYGIGVPDVPAANGTYNLQATVNNGDVTLTWQS